jgi:hypothetical protein
MDKFDVVIDGQKVEMSHEEVINHLSPKSKQNFWNYVSKAWVQTEPEELPDNVLKFPTKEQE